MRVRLSKISSIFFCVVIVLPLGNAYGKRQDDPKELVAALKSSLAQSRQNLRKYEWIETTSVSLKGEQKSSKQSRCYYGVDGKVQKVALSAPPEQPKQRGLRGRIIAKKKGEMTDYAEQAIGLVKLYIPPDPAQLQAVKDAGKLTALAYGQNQTRLEFHDYMLAGDVLSVNLDPAQARLLGAEVSTYLGKPKDAVTLSISFDSLPDGTSYPAQIILEMKAKNLRVTIQNSGYRQLT